MTSVGGQDFSFVLMAMPEITVRSIDREEIDLFVSIPDGTPNDSLKSYILNQWAIGESKPEWCFIASLGDRQVARVAYWTFEREPNDLKLGPWYLEWTDDFVAFGKALFEQSAAMLAEQAVRTLEARIFSQRTPQFDEREFVLRASGFTLEQEKTRFEFDNADLLTIQPQHLRFELVTDQNQDELIEIVTDVMAHSPDRADQKAVTLSGAAKAALNRIQMLKEIDSEKSNWFFGYSPENELVGCVIGQRVGANRAAINYIGARSDQRAKGFGTMLVKHGTEMLANAGFKMIVADTDNMNLPMINALKHCGFIPREILKAYVKQLNH